MKKLKIIKKLRKSLDKFPQLWYNILVNKRKVGKTKMKVTKTVKLEMTEEEKKAIKTVYHMLDLEWKEERALANELDYSDLDLIRTDLANLYTLGGGREEDLE